MINQTNKVAAKTKWVWTEKAAQKNPQFLKAGEPIWLHYLYHAPAEWIEEGLICEAEQKELPEGQLCFDF